MRYLILLFVCVTLGCASSKNHSAAPLTTHLVTDGKLWSAAFQQRAAEYDALCIQAYNLARLRLDEALKQPHTKPLAIITDVDETVLDNSPNTVQQALLGKDFESKSWNEWTSKATADTMSGALAFFMYAALHNVETFYITNREEKERKGTIENLRKYYFPYADDLHLLLRGEVASKEPRRQSVAQAYDIILFIGDNLSDFSTVFERKSEDERNKNVQALAAEFGKKFIVLPNFNYGGWEDAIYQNKRGWTLAQKDSLIKTVLKTN